MISVKDAREISKIARPQYMLKQSGILYNIINDYIKTNCNEGKTHCSVNTSEFDDLIIKENIKILKDLGYKAGLSQYKTIEIDWS